MIIQNVSIKIYNYIASILTKRLSKFREILGIYVRGSVSTGDIVLGKSDIDFIILIKKFDDPLKEGAFLLSLSKEYLKFKRFFPIIGECVIFDSSDIPSWFSIRTYKAYEAKKWKKLYGIQLKLPEYKLTDDDILYQICWKVFKYLQRGYTESNIKLLSNVFLELVMLIFYLERKIDRPILERRKFLEYLIKLGDEDQTYYMEMRKAFSHNFIGNFSNLKNFIFTKSLLFLDDLYYRFPGELKGKINGRYFAYRPFGYELKRYIVIPSPIKKKDLENYINFWNDPKYFLITSNLLKLYFYFGNPLEYYSLKQYNQNFKFSEPPKHRIDRFMNMHLTRKELRAFPFEKVNQKKMYNIIAQIKLYYDYDYIATDESRLRREYELCYGNWPFIEKASLKEYFLHDYPIMWGLLEKILGQQKSNPPFISDFLY